MMWVLMFVVLAVWKPWSFAFIRVESMYHHSRCEIGTSLEALSRETMMKIDNLREEHRRLKAMSDKIDATQTERKRYLDAIFGILLIILVL